MPYWIDNSPTKYAEIDNLVNLPADLFIGKPIVLEINNIIAEGVLTKDIATSFQKPPMLAFASFLSYLVLPFKGFEFDPFNFGVYLDVISKRIDLNTHKELVTAYESIAPVKNLAEFSFLLFDFKEGNTPDQLIY